MFVESEAIPEFPGDVVFSKESIFSAINPFVNEA